MGALVLTGLAGLVLGIWLTRRRLKRRSRQLTTAERELLDKWADLHRAQAINQAFVQAGQSMVKEVIRQQMPVFPVPWE